MEGPSAVGEGADAMTEPPIEGDFWIDLSSGTGYMWTDGRWTPKIVLTTHCVGIDCQPPEIIDQVWFCPVCGAQFRERLPKNLR